MSNVAAKPRPAAPFPLALAIAAAVVTGLGPAAATLNVQWGVDARPDALRYAWIYTNIFIAAVLMLVWPAIALTPKRRDSLLWDLPAIALAAIPALALAAFLSNVTAERILQTLTVQAGLAVFMAGMLTWQARAAVAIAAAAAVLTLALPLVAYLDMEFLGGSATWSLASPLITAASAAAGVDFQLCAWVVAAYALVGGVLMAWPRKNTSWPEGPSGSLWPKGPSR